MRFPSVFLFQSRYLSDLPLPPGVDSMFTLLRKLMTISLARQVRLAGKGIPTALPLSGTLLWDLAEGQTHSRSATAVVS